MEEERRLPVLEDRVQGEPVRSRYCLTCAGVWEREDVRWCLARCPCAHCVHAVSVGCINTAGTKFWLTV